MDIQRQQAYVKYVHEVVDAAEVWAESIHHDLGHPMYEDENCPHCRAKMRLEAAVARLIEVRGGPSDLSPH